MIFEIRKGKGYVERKLHLRSHVFSSLFFTRSEHDKKSVAAVRIMTLLCFSDIFSANGFLKKLNSLTEPEL